MFYSRRRGLYSGLGELKLTLAKHYVCYHLLSSTRAIRLDLVNEHPHPVSDGRHLFVG